MSEPVKIVLKRGNNTYVAFANKIELDNWKPGQDVPVDGRPGKRVVQFTHSSGAQGTLGAAPPGQLASDFSDVLAAQAGDSGAAVIDVGSGNSNEKKNSKDGKVDTDAILAYILKHGKEETVSGGGSTDSKSYNAKNISQGAGQTGN